MSTEPPPNFNSRRGNPQAGFDRDWDRRMTTLQDLGPELATARRAIINDACRRGLMDRISWVDIGLPSGELWPVVPRMGDDTSPAPDILIQGDLHRRRR